MKKFIEIIEFAFTGAKAIEQQLPDAPGKQKLDTLLGIGQLAFQQEEAVRNSWGNPDAFAKALTTAATIAVAALNASGIFKKKAA